MAMEGGLWPSTMIFRKFFPLVLSGKERSMDYFRPVLKILVTLGVLFVVYLAFSKVFGLGLLIGASSVTCGG